MNHIESSLDPKCIKALILAAGRGKRLEEHTEVFNKAMLKFGNKHLIEYSLDNALSIGVNEIIIVVGYKRGHIQALIGDSYKDVPVKYAVQTKQKGVVHAIECSRELIGESDFILQLADEYFSEPQHADFLRFFRIKEAFAVCGIVLAHDRENIRKTYSIEADEENSRIIQLKEKPRTIINNLMGTGNILFKNDIFKYIPITPMNPDRGERELPDLLQCAINDGQVVLYYKLASGYANVNKAEDMHHLMDLQDNIEKE